MADRNYIIEILLKARDDTARAFAEATGNVETYDKLIDEQSKHLDKAAKSHARYNEQVLRGRTATEKSIQSERNFQKIYKTRAQVTDELSKKIQGLERAQKRVNEIETKGKGTTADLRVAEGQLVNAKEDLVKQLEAQENIEAKNARRRAERIAGVVKQRVETANLTTEIERNAERQIAADTKVAQHRESLLRRAQKPADVMASPASSFQAEERAARELIAIRQQLERTGLTLEQSEKRLSTVRQQSLNSYGFKNRAARDEILVARDEVRAYEDVEKAVRSVARARASGAQVSHRTSELASVAGSGGPADPGSPGGPGGGFANTVSQGFEQAGQKVTEFSHGVGVMGTIMAVAIGPAIVLITGLVGAFVALASAATAAFSAVGVTFVSGIVQGLPVIGLFAAAMQRLSTITQYVSAQHQQLEQRFIAAYQAAYETRLGINQVTIAEHSYSDALFAQQQATINLRVSQLSLSATRQQATRQLQDLIFQEEQAKLAAEASSLSIVDAQKALRQAISSGGDVAAAQLQLQQAQVGHQQAVVQAQRSVTDASKGSIARQQISEQVTQAERAVKESRRAIVDAQFASAQARAAIIQARQAAAGFNVGIAAQLAWLRSQMTATEKSLAGNIQRIFQMFTGVHGKLRPFTDAILSAFIPLTSQIIKLFNRPDFMRALLNLSSQIGNAIRTITHTLFSNQAIQGFIKLVNAAASNLAPFARIVSDFFKSVGGIAQAAIPFVHQFLEWIAQAADKFASWTNSVKGQDSLAKFFKSAFAALKDFLKLGGAFLGLFAAIMGSGGGVREGTKIIDEMVTHINGMTASIKNHGRVWRDLHLLWKSIGPALHALRIIFDAVGRAFLQIGGSKQQGNNLKNIAQLVARVLVPAFVQFIQIIGHAAGAILGFLNKHPHLEKMIAQYLAVILASRTALHAVQLVAGPLGTLLGIIGQIAGKAGTIVGMIGGFGPVGLAIGAIAAAIVGVSAATGNLHNLVKTLEAPFIALWNAVKGPLKRLWDTIVSIGDSVGIHLGHHAHDAVATFLKVIGFLAKGFITLNPFVRMFVTGIDVMTGVIKYVANLIGTLVQVFKDVFHTIGDLIHGRFGKLPGDFLKIGKDIVKGLWNGLKAIADIFINVFKDAWHAITSWLGIGSPSKKFHSLGTDILNGLWNGLKAIVGFAGKIIGWISSGISHLVKFLLSLGGKIISWIWHGILDGAGFLIHLHEKIWGWIWHGFTSIVSKLFNLGKSIVSHIVDGIASVASDIWNAIFGSGPGISDKAINKYGLSGAVQRHFEQQKAEGGPIGSGYGGGDRVPVLAEAGEHMWSKEEVRSAGGHGAMYAMRRAFGGGRQGGPSGYALGGSISSSGPGGSISSAGPLGNVNSLQGLLTVSGRATQGVYGPLGDFLRNLRNFVNAFVIDWKSLWHQLNVVTANNIKVQNNDLTAWMNTMKRIWGQINTNTKNSLQNLVNNIHGALTNIDQSINKAFQYVVNATNASLKAFNAKPVKIDLGSIPKFASGFVGQMGERGKDAVPALLGRGEAVLNYAHQHMVEPAMRAYYGFGLRDMFGKVRGLHAGTKEEARGYAAGVAGGGGGGYQFPFSGSGWAWSRTDQGVDFGGNSPVGAIGPGVVTYSNARDGWYSPAPAFMVYKLTGGPDAGKYIYVAEHITNMAPVGTRLKAGQAVAQMTGGIEMGWAAGPQGHQIVLPMGADHLTTAGTDFHNFLIGLTHGVITGGNFGGGGAGVAWKKVKDLIVKGSGPMKDLVHGAIKKVIDAANKFGGDKAGSFAGNLGIPTGLSGTVMKQMFQAGIKLGLNKVAIAGMIGNAFQESALNPRLNDPSGKGLFSWTSGFGPDFGRIALGNVGQQMALAVRWLASNGYLAKLKAASSPSAAAVYFENVFERAGTPMMANRIAAAQRAFAQGYASGGVVGHKKEEGAPVPIVAHVGEWVLNKMQQSKLAALVGTSIGHLRNALGFSGGPTNFADGGSVEAGSPPPLPLSFYPHVQKSGIFPTSLTALDIPAFYSRMITTFLNEGKFIVRKVEEHGGHLLTGINDFIKNLAQATGDSGIFALAAQAVNDYVTHLQTNLSLALAGVRDIHRKLIFGAIPTALEGTNKTMRSLKSQGRAFDKLHSEDLAALRQINEQLRLLARSGVTKAERPLYQQLLGARKNMLTQLEQVDQSIAQNLTDRFDAATTAFQTHIDQFMRVGGNLFPRNRHQRGVDVRHGRFTLSGGDYRAATAIFRTGETARQYVENQMGEFQTRDGRGRGLGVGSSDFRKRLQELRSALRKIGPGIAAGIAAMNQSIAQTLGDPRREIMADRSVVQASYGTRDALRKAYDRAAKKAATDPRWQKVADDLLGQLQSAQEAVVQAHAQALQDRINKTDTRAQLQAAAIDMRNRLVQASVALGQTTQLGGIREQIGISRDTRAHLARQLTNYGNLYDVAVRQGNVQAMHDLTTKMEDLRAQIKEADVNTQQLVTSLRQTALTIVTNQQQTSGSFFQAGASIIQTLGQITGSLNLPQLIAVAKETGKNLVTGAQQISHSIQRTLATPHALGAFQGQAGALLTPLLAAFHQGPQAFAMELTKLGPSLAKLESKMPPDVATIFQGMIDSMIGNTQATVDNTQNLQQLNATTNQQNFASSAWTMFRQAIFTGLGTLLPSYATTVPSVDVGGIITNEGLLYGHKGEVITPASVRKGDFPSTTGGDKHFHFTEPMEVADPVHLGNAIAFRLTHDPNSR